MEVFTLLYLLTKLNKAVYLIFQVIGITEIIGQLPQQASFLWHDHEVPSTLVLTMKLT